MAWKVILLEEVDIWFGELQASDPTSADLVAAAFDILAERGPALGRPLVDTLSGSRIRNLKELRPGSSGSSEIRILFAFDQQRQAVMLVAGDKSGAWTTWYQETIPLAEKRFDEWQKTAD